MKLSIIVPVYNAAQHLDKCLTSLISQEIGGGYEIIAVNDGSTDASLPILEQWAQKYPQLIKVYSQANSGVSAARNLGIEKSSGEWIAFCDSDDYVARHSFGDLLNLIEKSEIDNLGLVKYKMRHVRMDEPVADNVTFNILYTLNNTAFFEQQLFWACCHFLYKRNILLDSNLRFKPVITSEDGLFNIEYLLCTKSYMVLSVDSEIYRYVSNPSSTCNRRNFEKAASFLSSYYQVFKRLNEIEKQSKNQSIADRMEWVKAKTLPNLYSRLIRSNFSYSQTRQHCKQITQLATIPSCIGTRRQRLMEFQICHPYIIVLVRLAYKLKVKIKSCFDK